MKALPFLLSTTLLSVSLLGCSDPAPTDAKKSSTATAVEQAITVKQDNPLLQSWTGPYQGVPAFDQMQLADLKPALEQGMAAHLADIDKITANPDAPTFDNTIVALEGVGKELDRVFTYYGIWSSNKSSEDFRAIQREMAPKLSEFSSKITQNEALFNRIAAVYNSEQMQSLTPEQQRLTTLVYLGFANNGATLNAEQKQRYAAINLRLSQLYTQFSNNILADEENYALYLSKEQLGGLPESLVNAAAAAATSRGKEGMYAITNTRSSMDPFLTYSTERELRQQVWNTYYSRGDNNDAQDNNALITEILALRDERVGLLGFDNYATWRLQDRMAKSPDRAMNLMMSVWPAAIARVQEEVADMQALATQQGADITIEPWDYRFYAEQVRKAKYDLNSDEVKQYLQLDKLREAMFYVAGRLFNFNFTAVAEGSVPVFHEDVKVWEVTDKTSGEHIGLWYLDPFARSGKRSGAWATSYRGYSNYDGEKNVLSSNNSNFMKSAPGKPVLISWDDAETYFHEFGHALHALSSSVTYPTLNGGVRDYTEFQSQLLERWLLTDEVINQFLVHHETGEPMPAELVTKIKKAATFNEGFKTTEYLASAIIDLKLHMLDDPKGIDPDAFERDTLTAMGMPGELVMRHRTPQFGHVFSGEGYAAAYYGYMWAEVLTSDAAEAFAEAPGGFYDKDVAARLVEHLFSVRNAVDPEEAYRAFRGRDAKIEALMRDRGFPLPPAK
ncbi:M3 family metallopeptidase [Arsukibacterium sp. UBA3155]|uniref:M3 family metallopeptidase n=1 Tax=Arsukibacterium sp. UBA3155 TaxID=1946058 RepID=UPI0025BC0541|nr:M3 family metallopeptidase [Arsukibacterium sp. UBA3155]|tara:strand:- start:6273 stop:8462 length:2190 start_codon:yes stop_codon:yes gene_type:complete